jgi:DNA invertase Pin-like site-specific DNA recombinase
MKVGIYARVSKQEQQTPLFKLKICANTQNEENGKKKLKYLISPLEQRVDRNEKNF